LIEAAWQYRLPARITPIIAKRQERVSEPIRALAWKAQQRLCSRYRRLAARHLHANKIVTALARELTGFVWAIVREARSAH
jgi:transposase